MEIEKQLRNIWETKVKYPLDSIISERSFNYSVNNQQKDILITGINPSFRIGEELGEQKFDFRYIAEDLKYDRYWTSLKKMLVDTENGINLLNRTAYLDIFYFREKDQQFLKKHILSSKEGLDFIVAQLNLTQHLIEDIIKPKVIIVKNKESVGYWGKLADKGLIWMGYDLKHINTTEAGELYQIEGLLDSSERVALEIKETNLVGTSILFTQHFQYAPVAKRPTALQIKNLLNLVENS